MQRHYFELLAYPHTRKYVQNKNVIHMGIHIRGCVWFPTTFCHPKVCKCGQEIWAQQSMEKVGKKITL
jgi:hypothetical protein